MFFRRLIKPELLNHAMPEAARANLADLGRINRYFDGLSVFRRMLERVAKRGARFTLLDVGAACRHTARLVQKLYPFACVTILDLSRMNLGLAPPPKLVADAFELPFRAESFDYVTCSLFLHHFEDQQVTHLLRTFYARASFRRHELVDLAKRAGLSDAEVEAHWPAFRLSLMALRRAYNPGGRSEVDTRRMARAP